ncbi:hypothetical protein N8005_01525 [Litorivicinus sp.]|nr:hypothetical protein [Litorivicinus sp.]
MTEYKNQHNEWLSLIEISGPFLAEPVLDQTFPQGLERIDPHKKKHFRQTYEEWREAIDNQDSLQEMLHQEWINWVLKHGLEWDEDDEEEELKTASTILDGLTLELPEHGLTLKPDYALFGNDQDKPYLLVKAYPPETNLNDVLAGDGWSTSPAERMSSLCRATGVRLGLLTNGEQWMLVDAPEGGIISYACWYARLWSQEPITLNAFFSLLNIRTVFNPFGLEDKKLPDLFEDSLKHQDEVTETLGEQVQRAVEVLIQSLDRINHDSDGKLLEGVEPTELYEAGLTFMMRLVFLLCAEERGLLLLGDETYEANYALSTLRMKLREEAGLHGEEVLSYRTNAWSRLLAIFRAVYGGVEHEGMRMPALGGSLFDPDRFPFLEGRPKESKWRINAAKPLPIDNRTVLLFLDAIQLFQGRTLSYRALDVEQIGYVYEGLLERTVVRSTDVSLELDATKSAKTPWVLLGELASAELDDPAAVKKLLKERTGSSATRITNDLKKEVTEAESEKLLLACQNDADLRDRIKPYYHFLRLDSWGNPMLYLKDAYMVATGTERRETGTHYTPKSLTETIVKETLEPVVYIGPSEGKLRKNWILKSPDQLLTLKICDLAMGSGAFLVQACRWLAERLCESWLEQEVGNKAITLEGKVVDAGGTEELLTRNSEERITEAKRLVAERCLYGVDINPLAVELAKLSIWLMTLSKGKPFGFLDHNLRSGDSLLGVTELNQLLYLDMEYSEDEQSQKPLFAQDINQNLEEAIMLRSQLRSCPIRDIRDVEVMAHLDRQARAKLELCELVADALVGETLKAGARKADTTVLAIEVDRCFGGAEEYREIIGKKAKEGLAAGLPEGKRDRRPFHWCLEFPEVFFSPNPGFNVFIGNPPFLGGKKISSAYGTLYEKYLKKVNLNRQKGAINYVVYFILQGVNRLCSNGSSGFIATDSINENESREVGLKEILNKSLCYGAKSSFPWPGKAGVHIAVLNFWKGEWLGEVKLNGESVDVINSMLAAAEEIKEPKKIQENQGICSDGVKVQGIGFVLKENEAIRLIKENETLNEVIVPYVVGDDLNTCPNQKGKRYVINFWDMSDAEASDYSEAWDILVKEVKPYRDGLTRQVHEKCFWKFWDRREKFFNSIRSKNRCLVCSKLSKHLSFSFGSPEYIYSEKAKVFDLQSYSSFAVLQSITHLVWHQTWGSNTGATPAYVGSKVFDTFPFPDSMLIEGKVSGSLELPSLEKIGKEYYMLRDKICKSENIGLTKIYNIFHDSTCHLDCIVDLRSAQRSLDEAVLLEYGFSILDLDYEFIITDKGERYCLNDKARIQLLKYLVDKNNSYQISVDKPDKKQSSKGQLSVHNNLKQSELFEAQS